MRFTEFFWLLDTRSRLTPMKLSIDLLFTRSRHRAGATLACALMAGALAATPAVAESVSESALAQISALRAEKESRTPVQRKIDSQLIYAQKQSMNQPPAPGVGPLRLSVSPDRAGRVGIDLSGQITPALLEFITASGGAVLSSVPEFDAARILFPLASVEALAARAEVRFVQAAVQAQTWTGSVDSEGDYTHSAFSSRPFFDATGEGVNVGVLSDSVDHMASSQASGDLPADVVVLPGQSGVPANGEGTAMLEIVHDLAPEAKLFYATAMGGPAQFARNILDLRNAGCDIIVDDVWYASESPFQDGVVARAVNRVTADGALFFSACGNAGNKKYGNSGTWEGDFTDGGDAGQPVNGKSGLLHLWGTNAYNSVTSIGYFNLFWADPLGASTNDYDLYVLDTNGTAVVSSSTTVQNGTQDPYEMAGYAMPGERLVIVKASGDARFLHVDSFSGQLQLTTEGFIRGHSASTNSFSVAAIDIHTAFPDPFTGGSGNPVQGFSSDGPRRAFFQADGSAISPGNFLATGGHVRLKPDLTAANGVVTTLPPFSGLNPFYGTSAAAPHAGALAALVKSYNPLLTPDGIRAILTATALDNEGPGWDVNTGFGIVMADAALAAAPPPAPLPKFTVVTNYLSGGNGNELIDYNECNSFDLVLVNSGRANATGVRVSLLTVTPGVTFAQANAGYPDMPVDTVATNQIAFRISTSPDFNCGIPIEITVVVKSDQVTTSTRLTLPSGTPGAPVRFNSSSPIAIPDAGTVVSSVFVTNVNNALNKVAVSMFLTHPYDADLTVRLVSPEGITNTLVQNRGSNGDNFGIGCEPETFRTTFDDAASVGISDGLAPFVGSYRPEDALSVFFGKNGTNVNGLWRLLVSDNVSGETGTLQCWSLILTPTICTNGGGECPGSDLTLGMVAQPDPVIVGNNLTYTLSVTNRGPSGAKNVSVSQVLPPSSQYVSATCSQGSAAFVDGIVTANLGLMPARSTATVTVVIIPTAAALAASSATANSEQPDFDLSNNSATILTQVNPPTSDLAIKLTATPEVTVVAAPVTYTLAVTNNGPSAAPGVTVTNVFPVGVVLLDQSLSQGSLRTIGTNIVVCDFGILAKAARATATFRAIPVIEGTLVANASASLAPGRIDPVAGNNTSTAPITVGPSADLGVTLSAIPNPVVVGTNVTYFVTLTNFGPSTATNVVVSQLLPVGAPVVSTVVSQGRFSATSSNIVWLPGSLTSGKSGTMTVVVQSTKLGNLLSSVSVTAAQSDPNEGNNSASASAVVSTPFISIAAAGASLTSESFSPPNGSIDPGETVTVQFRLQNLGNVPNTNLVATLEATGGVTSPGGPRAYGILKPIGVPGGQPVSQPFTFTAKGLPDGTVVATLRLQDGASALPPVSYTFQLPSVATFANTNAIAVPNTALGVAPGPGQPYPSTIRVSGVTRTVGKVTATLAGFTHTYPHDVSVLLVGPSGARSLLLAHAGAGSIADNLTITLDDTAEAPFGELAGLVSGDWQPSVYAPEPLFPKPAPAAPYETGLNPFVGIDPNGDWSLYVMDDSNGDTGVIANGWSLAFTSVTPVNQIADLGLGVVTSPASPMVDNELTYTFTITNCGPAGATGVIFNNVVPDGLTLVSATPSQGNCLVTGNAIVGNLASLAAGRTATIAVVVKPTVSASGVVTNNAAVTAFENDLRTVNNRASIVTGVNLPVANLALSQVASASVAITFSNLTYTLAITNAGPDKALNVVVTDPVPAGVVVRSATASQGTVAQVGGNVVASLGALSSGAVASVVLEVAPTAAGLLTNAATVTTLSADLVATDNVASTVVTVSNPAANVVVLATNLVAEGFTPANGAIDRGEQVTVSVALANQGQLGIGNLTATLLASGGITAPSAPANYGALPAGGTAVARPFTFTASPSAGAELVATVQLKDGSTDLGAVAVTFSLPASGVLASTNPIVIPDHGVANPYPSVIPVSGLSGLVGKVTVTLHGLSHSFPSDVNVLLVNPAGERVVLMSHAGGAYSVTNLTLTFDDGAAGALPAGAPLASGSFRPTRLGKAVSFPPPAGSAPYAAELRALAGSSPNGSWALYLLDDSTGDSGLVAQGWSLNITTITPISLPADLGISVTSSATSVQVGSTVTYTVSVGNSGPSTAQAVVIKDSLPASFNVVSNVSSQGTVTVAGSEVTCNAGDIPVGAVVTLSIVALPTQSGVYANSASVSSPTIDLSQENNAAQVSTAVINAVAPMLKGEIVNGRFQLTIAGQPGQNYSVLASPSLSGSWTVIGTHQAPFNGIITTVDTNSASLSTRYYRAIKQ